jgi:hypothetical protein
MTDAIYVNEHTRKSIYHTRQCRSIKRASYTHELTDADEIKKLKQSHEECSYCSNEWHAGDHNTHEIFNALKNADPEEI